MLMFSYFSFTLVSEKLQAQAFCIPSPSLVLRFFPNILMKFLYSKNVLTLNVRDATLELKIVRNRFKNMFTYIERKRNECLGL